MVAVLLSLWPEGRVAQIATWSLLLRLSSTYYVAGALLDVSHGLDQESSSHFYDVAASIKDEETGAQRSHRTCPRSCSWWQSPYADQAD